MDTKKLLILAILVVLEFYFSLLLNPTQYTSDSGAYTSIILKLAGGNTDWPSPHYSANLIYPLVTLPFYLITNNMDLSCFISSLLFYILLTISTYLVGISLKFNEQLSLMLSALVISHPIVIGYSSLALTDIPALAVAVTAIYFFITNKNIIPNGLIFGITLLTRPQYFIMYPMYFADKNLKKAIGVLIISAILTFSWSLFSNASPHPIMQFLSVSNLVSGSEMPQKNLTEHLSLGGRLKDLFIGLTFLFFYQIFFVFLGFKKIKDKKTNLILSLITISSIIVLFFYPLKVARYFLVFLLPFTIWALLGMRAFLNEYDKDKFLPIIVSGIIVLNQVLTLLFFRSNLNPLPS